jgi:enoyl-CoA hydratase/carnithine racemase
VTYETILADVQDGVAILTLNRPERLNAWNAVLARELSAALDAAEADDGVRAVVLTGAGRAFCAGADLEAGGDTFDDTANEARRDGADAPTRLPWQLSKPVIAAINGAAVGVGITYPLLADLRFVAEDAKISFAFVRRGMIPELSSHVVAARVLGLSGAADLLLSGRMITGREAVELGLASAALPADQVLTAAVDRAREFTLAAPVSVAIAKRLLWEPLLGDIRESARREDALFAWVGRQPDAKEGIASFLERRQPSWTMSPARDLPDWPS